jgi:hypothetical protein
MQRALRLFVVPDGGKRSRGLTEPGFNLPLGETYERRWLNQWASFLHSLLGACIGRGRRLAWVNEQCRCENRDDKRCQSFHITLPRNHSPPFPLVPAAAAQAELLALAIRDRS